MSVGQMSFGQMSVSQIPVCLSAKCLLAKRLSAECCSTKKVRSQDIDVQVISFTLSFFSLFLLILNAREYSIKLFNPFINTTPYHSSLMLSSKGGAYPSHGILKGEVSLYRWPPVWLVWNQLYDNRQFLFLFAKQTNPNQSNRRSMVQW